jgi:plastocyanin
VLNRAGTKGTTGPSLDQAFQQDVRDGFGESAIRGVVYKQIGFARTGGVMPQNLVKGEDARDVAAYVARVVAQPGKDTGLLASAVKAAGSGKPALAKGGKLSIPADPGGQLAFASAVAQAPAGKLTIEMPNTSGVQHNIAIDGKGAGKIVSNGTSSFSAQFAAGTYTYYCQVPGHKQAGMAGKLTVK